MGSSVVCGAMLGLFAVLPAADSTFVGELGLLSDESGSGESALRSIIRGTAAGRTARPAIIPTLSKVRAEMNGTLNRSRSKLREHESQNLRLVQTCQRRRTI